jgi:hypothetical protein
MTNRKPQDLIPLESNYKLSYYDKIRLTVPMQECHPMFGPSIVKAYLADGWVLDGNFIHDIESNQMVVNLRKL